MKIATKLNIGTILLISIICILALVAINITQVFLRNETGRSSVFLTEEMMKRINYAIFLRTDEIRRLGYDSSFRFHMEKILTRGITNAQQTKLNAMIKTLYFEYYDISRGYQFYEEIKMLDNNGKYVCGYPEKSSHKKQVQLQKDTIIRMEKNKGFAVEYAQNEEETGSPLIHIYTGINNEEGENIGIFQATVSLASLIRETEILIKRYDSTEIVLTTLDGRMLYRSEAFLPFQDISESPCFRKLKESENNFFTISEKRQMKLVSYAGPSHGFSYFDGMNWVLILKHNMGEILAETNTLGKAILIIFTGFLFFSVLISFLFTRSTRKAIGQLSVAAHHVASGDLSYRILDSTNDELGEFAQTFNRMTERLQTVYKDLEREIEERKKTEQKLKKLNRDLIRSNQELDDFTYIVSHDLREPLRGIRSYVEFLLSDYRDKFDEEGKELLDTLQRLTDRLDHLIQSLLYYSRAGRFELSFEEVDMNEVIQEQQESLSHFLKEQNAEIIVENTLPTIQADKTRVGEIFYNLITNGIKYNDNEKKTVWIGSEWKDRTPVFYVRDNGIGVRDKHKETVFKMFKRLHPRDKYGGGTGSGLTIVKKFVDRQGGDIWLESEYGRGTIFRFTLNPKQKN